MIQYNPILESDFLSEKNLNVQNNIFTERDQDCFTEKKIVTQKIIHSVLFLIGN